MEKLEQKGCKLICVLVTSLYSDMEDSGTLNVLGGASGNIL